MTEQRSGQQWIIKVNGAEQTDVKPGESIEIGRKPLRPLADDGNRRLEVPDSERSMSKRHALFTVHEDGSADVRDLNSTNGSYMIRENGELTRLQPGVECELKYSPIRLQFGDIPVDFIRVEAQEHVEPKVTDLFSYAPDNAKQEPDPSDMSVDDILNLRAGEPTAIFSSQNVADRLRELRDASLHVPKLVGTEPDDAEDHQAAPDKNQQAKSDQAAAAQEGQSPSQRAASGADAGMQTPANAGASASGADAQLAQPHTEHSSQRVAPQTRALGAQPILPDPVVTVTQQRQFAEQHPLEELPLTVQPGGLDKPGPRDLFADAAQHSEQKEQAEQQSTQPENASSAPNRAAAGVAAQDNRDGHASPATADSATEADRHEVPASSTAKPGVVSVHDLFSAERIREVQMARAADEREASDQSEHDRPQTEESPENAAPTSAERHAQTPQAASQPADPAARVTFTPMDASVAQAVPDAHSKFARTAQTSAPSQSTSTGNSGHSPSQQASPSSSAEDYSRFARPAAQQSGAQQVSRDAQQDFKPVFEPGSVFERVSRGDFDQQEQMVEAGGYTSQQAKTTSDYTIQFQIARHAQLLPFLAMNPSLYDDLYTWLAAQGNADVDAALSRNQGYQEYRKAVGK
ncbi:FHA domain-containing protein [Bifidobacterium apri]|uniref:variant leucine-rich repeat-containing protein n=1 Tax=Bifidobacterium apri TaxID=1769423 RepID=UPI003993F404